MGSGHRNCSGFSKASLIKRVRLSKIDVILRGILKQNVLFCVLFFISATRWRKLVKVKLVRLGPHDKNKIKQTNKETNKQTNKRTNEQTNKKRNKVIFSVEKKDTGNVSSSEPESPKNENNAKFQVYYLTPMKNTNLM